LLRIGTVWRFRLTLPSARERLPLEVRSKHSVAVPSGFDWIGRRTVRDLDDQGLYWLEEPIAYDNLRGYGQLTRELNTPLAARRELFRPRALYQSLLTGAGDYFMPDLMRIGGGR
jgi:hypothetical protein